MWVSKNVHVKFIAVQFLPCTQIYLREVQFRTAVVLCCILQGQSKKKCSDVLLLDFEWFQSFVFSISPCMVKHSNEELLCVSDMLTCLFPDVQSCQAKSYFPKHVCVLVAGASMGSCWQRETDFPIKHINKVLWELTCLDWVLPHDSLKCKCQLGDKRLGHLVSFIKRQKNRRTIIRLKAEGFCWTNILHEIHVLALNLSIFTFICSIYLTLLTHVCFCFSNNINIFMQNIPSKHPNVSLWLRLFWFILPASHFNPTMKTTQDRKPFVWNILTSILNLDM